MSIRCRCYTRARTFPKVIGSIAGTPLHTTVSYSQGLVLLSTFIGLVMIRDVWTPIIPGGTLDLLVATGIPIALGRYVRYGRYEGRAPRHAATGLSLLWWRVIVEPGGRMRGRSCHDPKPRAVRRTKVFVSPGADA